jgi:glutamate-1-semialdehyde 2,1-aminomutase
MAPCWSLTKSCRAFVWPWVAHKAFTPSSSLASVPTCGSLARSLAAACRWRPLVLSGNPVATACGLATLKEISKPGFFEALAQTTRSLVDGLSAAARTAGVPLVGDCEGGMFGFFFADALPQNYGGTMATDKERFNRFFHAMLDRGVYLAPALYEAGFVSAAHSAQDVADTVSAARQALQQ